MIQILFSDRIRQVAPDLQVIAISARCSNPATPDTLWDEITEECNRIASKYKIEEIKLRPGIAATRVAYKALGKEPNRYRPSSEAMCRRIVNGKGLYRMTALIDIINLVSIRSGYSIGGFDADRIVGDSLTLDAGNHDDVFCGIGRGPLNIEGLPVYRDEIGGIGTPTSDEERTKLTPDTTNLLMLINIYGKEAEIDATLDLTISLLEKYAALESVEAYLVNASDGQRSKLR